MTTDVIINKTERPNSYEFGKAGNRFKLYFDDAIDLHAQMQALKDLGLIDEPIKPLEDFEESKD